MAKINFKACEDKKIMFRKAITSTIIMNELSSVFIATIRTAYTFGNMKGTI